MRYFGLLAGLAAVALAAKRTTAPAGSIVVDQNGNGNFLTIQDAVDSLSPSTTKQQTIFINSGTYEEQVFIGVLDGPLIIYGYTQDTTSYKSNKVIITAGESQETQANNDKTATLRVWTSNVKIYNINVVNSFGEGSQALALSANTGKQGYYGCSFIGFQDTVLAQNGTQLYAKTYIEGATDFIFGQYGLAWFEHCDLRVPAKSLGYIVASGRASAAINSWYVINNSTIAAVDGASVPAGAYYLGRPWREFARVVFQYTTMSAVINSAGWSIWSKDLSTANVAFSEYSNSGDGSKGTRASFSKKLTQPVAIETVLGSGYASQSWVDMAYM